MTIQRFEIHRGDRERINLGAFRGETDAIKYSISESVVQFAGDFFYDFNEY